MIEMFHNTRGFRLAALLVAAQALVMTLMAVFRVGGEQFIDRIFDFSSPVYAAISLLAAFWGWSLSSPKEISRRIWGWMAAGLLLWTIAELLWVYYVFAKHSDIPYPSPADFFWLAGYIPLFASLILRVQSFHVGLNQRQARTLLASSAAILVVCALTIFRPMLQYTEPARWLESLVNILYALGDLGLIGLSLWIILALQRGRFSTVWLLVAGSNVIRGMADLVFTYATWHDATLTSASFYAFYVVFNIPYLSAYLISALGMLAYYYFLRESRQTGQAGLAPAQPDISTALIFTDSSNLAIAASSNFTGLAQDVNNKTVKGQPLHELLGVESGVVEGMMRSGGRNGLIKDYPLEIAAPGQAEKVQAWVTATSDRSDGEAFNGLNIALRLKPGSTPAWAELDTQSRAIARRIMKDTGQLSVDNTTLLRKYFQAVVLGLLDVVHQLAGQAVAQNMREHFNQQAASGEWAIRLDQRRLLISDELKEDQLALAFIQLLKATADYAVDVLNMQVVVAQTKKIELQLSPRTLKTAQDFGLRSL